jgi:HTH-type transcriptional regulator, competence development regulator
VSNSVGHMVKTMRLEKAWSQEQLADASGISVRTIQRLEQGQPASLETVKALAACFQVPAALFSASAPHQPSEEPMTATALPDQTGRLKRSFALYAVVMVLLAAVNLTTSPEHLWVIYPALGWGLALAFKALRHHFRA